MKPISRLTLLTLLITGGIMVCQKPVISAFGLFTQEVTQIRQSQEAEADRLYEKGIEALGQNQFEAAINLWEQALILYREDGNKKGEANTLRKLGDAHNLGLEAYDKAMDFYKKSVDIAREIQDQEIEGRGMFNWGGLYFQLGKYDEAIKLNERSLEIFKQINERELEALAYAGLGDIYDILQDYEKSITYYENFLLIADKEKQSGRLTEVLNNLGLTYKHLGDYEKSINHFNESLNFAEAMGNKEYAATILMNLSSSYSIIGNISKQGEKALQYARETENESLQVGVLHNLGTYYLSLDQADQSLKLLNQALTLNSELISSQQEILNENQSNFSSDVLEIQLRKKQRNQATIFNSLGNVHINLAQYIKALEFYEKALEISTKIDDKRGQTLSYFNVLMVYGLMGQYQKEIDVYEEALTGLDKPEYIQLYLTIVNNLGAVYNSVGKPEEATKRYKEALEIAVKIGDIESQAIAQSNIGEYYLSVAEDYNKSQELMEQALSNFKKIDSPRWEAKLLNNLALVYYHLGQKDKGIQTANTALEIAKKIRDRNAQLYSLGVLSNISNYSGDFEESIEYELEALKIARETQDKDNEIKSLGNIGSAYFDLQQYAQAEEYLFESLNLYEQFIRADLTDSNKFSIIERYKKIYSFLEGSLLAQNKIGEALEVAERGRARALIDSLSENLPASPSPLKTKQIKAIASQLNSTLVEYSISDRDLRIWVISPDGKITFRYVPFNTLSRPIDETAESTRVQASLDRSRGISQNPDIVNRVRGIQDSVRSPFSETPLPTTPQGRTLNPQLQETYQLLIAPIADLLPQDPNQKVIFIPHRELFEIPFAALQDKEGTYLIEKHTILTSPSIALLDITRQNRQQKQTSNESLIVGYPEMPTQFERLQAIIPRQSIKNTLQEAQTIAKKYNTQAITGKEATETLIKEKMQNAKLIHLASHGLLNEHQGMVNLPDNLSKIPGAIALTPSDQDDGLLTASEIIDMKLNADLVVLSACETGRGDITGEGVNGLSRAFLRAGASNLVISFWKVPDDTTLDLMLEFYQQLETTPDKAIALRQAMLNTMKKHPEPRHWGGFTLTGAANPKN